MAHAGGAGDVVDARGLEAVAPEDLHGRVVDALARVLALAFAGAGSRRGRRGGLHVGAQPRVPALDVNAPGMRKRIRTAGRGGPRTRARAPPRPSAQWRSNDARSAAGTGSRRSARSTFLGARAGEDGVPGVLEGGAEAERRGPSAGGAASSAAALPGVPGARGGRRLGVAPGLEGRDVVELRRDGIAGRRRELAPEVDAPVAVDVDAARGRRGHRHGVRGRSELVARCARPRGRRRRCAATTSRAPSPLRSGARAEARRPPRTSAGHELGGRSRSSSPASSGPSGEHHPDRRRDPDGVDGPARRRRSAVVAAEHGGARAHRPRGSAARISAVEREVEGGRLGVDLRRGAAPRSGGGDEGVERRARPAAPGRDVVVRGAPRARREG